MAAVAMAMDLGGWNSGPAAGKRRIAVVADPGRESRYALEWALYHAVLEGDEIILLHVEQPTGAPRRTSSSSAPSFSSSTFSSFLRRPSSLVLPSATSRGAAGDGKDGECQFLHEMQGKCEAAQPNVKVHIERVGAMEGKDKASTILTHTTLLSVDLLVIGQRRNSTSFLGCKISGSVASKCTDTAEILIEKSKCMCIGVQKKGQNTGYLLNTKTRKNFWLLA